MREEHGGDCGVVGEVYERDDYLGTVAYEDVLEDAEDAGLRGAALDNRSWVDAAEADAKDAANVFGACDGHVTPEEESEKDKDTCSESMHS